MFEMALLFELSWSYSLIAGNISELVLLALKVCLSPGWSVSIESIIGEGTIRFEFRSLLIASLLLALTLETSLNSTFSVVISIGFCSVPSSSFSKCYVFTPCRSLRVSGLTCLPSNFFSRDLS